MRRENSEQGKPSWNGIRQRIYEIIAIAKDDDIASTVYDIIMMVTILVSLIPLAFTEEYPVFSVINNVTVVIFIIDYVMRFLTADLKLKKGNLSFLLYPFTPMALIDLVCILSALPAVNTTLKVLKVLRLLRTFRVIKALRYSVSVRLFLRIFRAEKEALRMVAGIAILYILVFALIMLNLEPETFGSYLNAVYWMTITLTTIGYGDLAPVTAVGKVITILTSFMGVAIVAMPTGIIASGLLREVGRRTDDDPGNDDEPYEKDKDRFNNV